MAHRAYFWSIGSGTVIAWGAFGTLVAMTRPTDSTLLLVGFFGTLFCALAGTAIILMTWVWCRGTVCATDQRRLPRAVRHGLVLAVYGTSCALLQWYGYLTWYTALLVLGALVLCELFIILVRRTF